MTDRDNLIDELLTLALRAAEEAARLIHGSRPSTLEVSHKSTLTDSVTNMDLASEALIRSIIEASRPEDLFIGEESSHAARSAGTAATDETGSAGSRSAVTWIVDPIDGTTNYLYDLAGYNVSIAAELDGEVVVGVVADPAHGRLYRARAGGGSFCNDVPLSIADKEPVPLDRALIATGFAYGADVRARQGRVIAELLPKVRDIRRIGAAALDLCHVAAGRVDAYFEVNLERWDLAAGGLIAREAGAMVGPIQGGPPMPASVVATAPELFDELQRTLNALGAGSVL